MNMDKSRDMTGQNPITEGDLEWILTKVAVNGVNSNIDSDELL